MKAEIIDENNYHDIHVHKTMLNMHNECNKSWKHIFEKSLQRETIWNGSGLKVMKTYTQL